MPAQMKETLNAYDAIVCHWTQCIVDMKNALADVEEAIIKALDKQYADVLSPLKDNFNPKLYGLKHFQKLSKRTGKIYFVPDEVLDDIFASQMLHFLGNASQEKDLEPPRSIMGASAMLCNDVVN
ncbi:hypothetical protein K2173_014593 [Erythroxylum novogranatense]|uniref:Uncharacterized protein n=1 Tax=Erythroxylum novogranatense TaxID=1862640 RepID=A0AAV8TF78_9ROSI|nr:hypothetical protein K2173_014593 [Erythroxylum novogranatense]